MSKAYKTFEGKLYYVTLTVVGWMDVFTRKEYVYEIADNFAYCQKHKGLQIYAYVIMSNHLHLICRTKEGSLNEVLGDFKSFTAKKIISMVEENSRESRKEWLMHMFRFYGRGNGRNKEFQFWRNGNHALELWSARVIKQKIDYMHNNPVKLGVVAAPDHYLYSSANSLGLIKVLEL